MKKRELKDYNRLLKMENEDLWELLLMAENTLGDDSQCGEIKLLQEENNELVKDLNDLQADWAADHALYTKEVRRSYKKDRIIRDLEETIKVLEESK